RSFYANLSTNRARALIALHPPGMRAPLVWSPTSREPAEIRVSGAAEDVAWEAQLTLANPTSGAMWVDLVAVGPALAAFPTHVGIRAGASETARLTVTRARLTRANAAGHHLQVTWNVIASAGEALTVPT